ncbi:MAG: hypothetical protein WD696_20000 [Bryobacteraceae bacterium]
MPWKIQIAAVVLHGALLSAAVPNCPAGLPVGNVQLQIQSVAGDSPRPLRGINRVQEGDELLYAPVIRGRDKREGEVAMVLVPASASKREEENLVVLDPKPAQKPARWKVPFGASLVVYVYGPDGLNAGKVKRFLSRDHEFISQLADYAERTAQTEALLQALATPDEMGAGENLNAALQGFASNYGISNKLDRNAPMDQQTMALFRNLNPALSAYDPISPQGGRRLSQTTGLATTVAAMFLGNPVGLAAGGAAMGLNLKTLLFPNTEFRSSFAQPISSGGVTLCGKREPSQGRTRMAYLWALRIPDSGPPEVAVAGANHIPLRLKTPVQVKVADAQWKILDRAHDWALIDGDGKAIPVGVRPLTDKRALEVDLTRAEIPPGSYGLKAGWDWDSLTVDGEIFVHALSAFEHAKLSADSHDRLIHHSGKQVVELEGEDFQFVEKVALTRSGDKYDAPVAVPFSLPLGQRKGPQQWLEMEVDTTPLDPGRYSLLLTQQDGRSYPVQVQVLPEPPKIVNLPLRVNQGEKEQTVAIRGEGLDRLASIEADGVKLELKKASADGRTREARVELPDEARKGDTLDLQLGVRDYARPIALDGGLAVVGPRPGIAGSRLSLPDGMEIALRPNELPAGIFAATLLRVRNTNAATAVRLNCASAASDGLKVSVGEESATAKLQAMGAGSLYLSFDPGAWPNGCRLMATLENPEEGLSEPYELGRVVRLPRIEGFRLTDEPAGNGDYVGVLTGRDLETIERTGWNTENGSPVPGLPAAMAGGGQKQSLKIRMPWPSPAPHAPLYVWLRGERQGRATTSRY